MKSFLNRLFGNKVENQSAEQAAKNVLLEPVSVSPSLTLPRVLADHMDQIEPTKRETIAIKATPDENLSLRQSKFGHYPCVPKDFEYPKDREGNFLYPLAQINFSEVPHLANFPSSGYLQFYIAADDTYGLSFEKDVPSEFSGDNKLKNSSTESSNRSSSLTAISKVSSFSLRMILPRAVPLMFNTVAKSLLDMSFISIKYSIASPMVIFIMLLFVNRKCVYTFRVIGYSGS